MVLELPLYIWLLIAVICVFTVIVKFPVYKNVFGKKKEQESDNGDHISG
ncbi:MAG: hypothetical protein JXJ04_06620 [Spirochaetales bacterium]|nr:hypothetical protein [Spirochaetales bacterium]